MVDDTAHMTIAQVAALHETNESVVRRAVKDSKNPPPQPPTHTNTLLTATEEKQLAAEVQQRSQTPFGLDRLATLQLAREMFANRKTRFSLGWLARFCERNNISLHASHHSKLTPELNACAARGTVRYWECWRVKTAADPDRMWLQVDETCAYTEATKPFKVLAFRGTTPAKQYCSSHDEKLCFTVTFAVTLSGVVLPPTVLFWNEGGVLQVERLNPTPAVTAFIDYSETGWQNSNTFLRWIQRMDLIMKQFGKKWGVIFDNVSMHIEDNVIQFLNDNDIDWIAPPADTTFNTQLLDVGVFGPFQNKLDALYRAMMSHVPTKPLTAGDRRARILAVVERVSAEINSEHIFSGARQTGLFRCAASLPPSLYFDLRNRQEVVLRFGESLASTTGINPPTLRTTEWTAITFPRAPKGNDVEYSHTSIPVPSIKRSKSATLESLNEIVYNRYASPMWQYPKYVEEMAQIQSITPRFSTATAASSSSAATTINSHTPTGTAAAPSPPNPPPFAPHLKAVFIEGRWFYTAEEVSAIQPMTSGQQPTKPPSTTSTCNRRYPTRIHKPPAKFADRIDAAMNPEYYTDLY